MNRRDLINVSIGLLIALIIVLINRMPNGYVFAFGDFNQIFNLSLTHSRFLYTWTEYSNLFGNFFPLSSFYLFYSILWPVDALFHSPALLMQITWFIMIFGSFLSFYYALKLLNIEEDKHMQLLSSLIYALNLFIVSQAMHQYFNRLHSVIYILIPIFFALLYNILEKRKKSFVLLSVYGIILFACTFAFGNPAFLLMLALVGGTIILYKALTRSLNLENTIITIVLSFLILSSLILPLASVATENLQAIKNQEPNNVSVRAWMVWQSTAFTDLFRMATQPSASPFFDNFAAHTRFLDLWIFLSFIYALLFLCSFLYKNKHAAIVHLCGINILLLFFLASKLSPPFAEVKWHIMSNSVLLTLRSTEKILLFIPFFFILGMAIFFDSLKNRPLKYGAGILVLLIAGLLFTGMIFTKYNSVVTPETDYQHSEYSLIVHMPADYEKLATTVNPQHEDFRILELPYSIINSENWVNFPTWKHIGSDPTQEIIDKPLLNPNMRIGDWFPTADFTSRTSCDEWLTYYASTSNVKYLLYHKDVDKRFLNPQRLNYLKSQQLITQVDSNPTFDLYTINKSIFKPRIYSNVSFVTFSDEKYRSPSSIPSFFCGRRDYSLLYTTEKDLPLYANTNISVEYVQINPTKYKVIVHNAQKPFPLVFSAQYSDKWQLYYSHSDINTSHAFETLFMEKANATHFVANGYLNAWIVSPKNDTTEFTLEYTPQRFFYVGILLSVVTFAACIGALAWNRRAAHERK